jgi:hypothetical protein
MIMSSAAGRACALFTIVVLVAATARADGVRPAGPSPGVGEGVTVTAAPDGRLLVYGGGGARTWNPERRSWQEDLQAESLSRRFHHSATTTPGGRIVAVGGLDVPFTNRIQQPALASTASWRVRSGRWENGPGLLSPRLWHAAVAMPPDDVLVIGGVAAATADKPFGALLASVELLGENASVQKAPLKIARIRHTATRLADGRVLVAGGTDDAGAPLASVEIYDPRADRWQAGASLATARTRHAATLLTDGRVLVSGGRDADGRALRGTELYDPAHDAWTRGPDLIEARWDHEAPLLADGGVLVAGGWTFDERPAAALESWNAADRAWRPAGQLPRTLRDARVVPIAGGTVLLFGQDPYDGAFALAWRREFADEMPPPVMHDAGFTALPDGRFIVVGGTRRQVPSPLVNVYDPRAGTWTSLRPLPHARTGARAIALRDGRLVVFGGDVADDDSDLRTPADDRPTHPALIWDPAREDWTPSAALALPDASWAEPTLLPDGRVQLLGIDTSGRNNLVAAYRIWDPRDDSIDGPIQVPRPRFGGAVLRHPDGSLVLLGGEARSGDGDESRRADRWDAAERRWRTMTPASLSLEGAEFIPLDDGGALAVWHVPAKDGGQRPFVRLLPDGSWRTLAPPPEVTPRSVLQAKGLKDGALLVVVDGLRSWVYEAERDAWAPMLHDARWTEMLEIVATPDGGALAFRAAVERGYGMATLGVVRLDRKNGRWEPLAPGWQARPHPALLDLGHGEVLAAGGQSAIVQVYQPASDRWRYEAFLPEPLDGPVALRMADGRVMLAGTTMGESPAALCLTWTPGAREWTSCGRFALAPGEPRRRMTLRRLDAERLLLVYGDARAVIRDRTGTWTASRMQVPQSPAPPDADETGTPFNAALAGVWDPQKNTWVDATDAWLANAMQVTTVGGTDPAEPWILQWSKWRRWNAATRTLTGKRLDNPPADGDFGAAVRIGPDCAVAWNDTKASHDVIVAFNGGAAARTIQAVDYATGKWQAAPPALPAWHASGLVLEDGTLLLAGLGVHDERPGVGAVRFRATCAGVQPLSAERVLWLPSRAATLTSAARDTTVPPPKAPATLRERMTAAATSIVDEIREHPQRTALPGLLLVFLLYGRVQRRSLYADDDVASTWRVVDGTLAVAALPLAFAALAIPHDAGRHATIAACLLLSAAATYRLWRNARRPASKYALSAAVVGTTVPAVLASGLALVHLFTTMIRNLTA